MKKVYHYIVSFALFLSLLCFANVMNVQAQGTLNVGGQTYVSVNEDQTEVYSFTLSRAGCVNLHVATSYSDRKKIIIKLLDANNNELMNDSYHWETNALNDSLNDLHMVKRLIPGNYKVTFAFEGDGTWNYNVDLRYLPDTDVAVNASWKIKLYGNEEVAYKVTVPADGYYQIVSSAQDNDDLYFYILNQAGQVVDDDDNNPDWKYDNVTGFYRMNWQTKALRKGTYYIKIWNDSSNIIDVPVKINYKIPTLKLTVKKSKITLKKGKSLAIKASMVPANTTDILSFASSNKKVVTVNKKGVIKAKKAGTANVTIKTTSGLTKVINVKVK